jgi:prepilin-type N-terminal cleavage/methylation domain-containing protein
MPKQPPQLRRSGFTLIELLATSMLAALLTLAVLRVVSTLARTQQPPPRDFSSAILDVLRHDFTNSRSVQITTGSIVLIEYSEAPQRLQITYGVTQIAGRSWLVRRESRLDSLVASTREELVAPDVEEFSLASASATTRPTDTPNKLRITIRFSNRSQPPINATLFR